MLPALLFPTSSDDYMAPFGRHRDDLIRARLTRMRLSNTTLSVNLPSSAATSPPQTVAKIDHAEARYLLLGFANGKVCLYDLNDTRNPQDETSSSKNIPPRALGRDPSSSKEPVGDVAWYNFDPGLFATSNLSNEKSNVAIWDVSTMSAVSNVRLPALIHSLASSASPSCPTLIACAGKTGNIHVIDMRTSSSTRTITGAHDGAVVSIDWSPRDESLVASGGEDGTVKLWDLRRSSFMVASLDEFSQVGVGTNTNLYRPGLRHAVEEIGLRAKRGDDDDDAHAVRAKRRRTVYDTSTRVTAHRSCVNFVEFVSSGGGMLTTASDGTMRLWHSTSDGYKNAHADFPLVEALSRLKNKKLAVGGEGRCEVVFAPCARAKNSILMADLHTGKALKYLNGHFGAISSLAYRRDHQELYSFSNADGLCLRWTCESPAVGRRIFKHEEEEGEEEKKDKARDTSDEDEDCWSSEDDV